MAANRITKDNVVHETIRLFEECYGVRISETEAVEIVSSLEKFFDTLHSWVAE